MLRELVECAWTTDAQRTGTRILPDGCMDLIRMDGEVVVAGPDTTVHVGAATPDPVSGLRFRPGVLPRLLGVPAAELRNRRIPLSELRSTRSAGSLVDLTAELAAADARPQTAPWSLATLRHVTARLAAGATVSAVARDAGWSPRTLQRQCTAVYGYGPATLRRILRFRRAMHLLDHGSSAADAALAAGYADQPHLHREVRALAGVTVTQLVSGANRSTEVPSGSSTVA
jgi:AraC-like DNA-binding protein